MPTFHRSFQLFACPGNGYHGLYGAPDFVKSIGVCVAPTLRSFNWRGVNILCSIEMGVYSGISVTAYFQPRTFHQPEVRSWLVTLLLDFCVTANVSATGDPTSRSSAYCGDSSPRTTCRKTKNSCRHID